MSLGHGLRKLLAASQCMHLPWRHFWHSECQITLMRVQLGMLCCLSSQAFPPSSSWRWEGLETRLLLRLLLSNIGYTAWVTYVHSDLSSWWSNCPCIELHCFGCAWASPAMVMPLKACISEYFSRMVLPCCRTNNPVILQLLLSLSGSVATNSLAQDLTVWTVSTCPDLLLSYLRSTSFSYEPSPTSKWVKMMEFLIRVCSFLEIVCHVLDQKWAFICHWLTWKLG